MRTPLLRLAMMPRIILVALAAAIIVVACGQEPDIGVALQKTTLLSFSFWGRSSAVDFEILELPRTNPLNKTNPYSFSGKTIWKISAPNTVAAESWPSITYEHVPDGFTQFVPDQGPPPKLSEDKLYVARISNGKGPQGAMFFEIRNGKPVNVTDELFRR
jgi:hypothetical protein